MSTSRRARYERELMDGSKHCMFCVRGQRSCLAAERGAAGATHLEQLHGVCSDGPALFFKQGLDTYYMLLERVLEDDDVIGFLQDLLRGKAHQHRRAVFLGCGCGRSVRPSCWLL